MEKKTRRIEIRLTEKEYELFQKKGENYPTKTCMIVEAVRQMGDLNARQKLAALAEMTNLYKQYQQQLSWMGSNLNQAVKRANELAIGQELTVPFFECVLYPQIEKILELLERIREEQHIITLKIKHIGK
ncbi:hypothetical protein [Bacteroides sp. Marseille-P3684]|uniref:hypothetical protein n=1 Tax=Bacteroides sp. Marseille-P3684 TaxID=2086579 RepID=UPI000D0B7D47|nr:hypothetical protein [Bacteroides sp. Marseille-P3684]